MPMRPMANDWQRGLEQYVLQEPLIETNPSLRALRAMGCDAPPRAVLVGIGLCTQDRLGSVLPLDVLGMLLPAERIRRLVGASSLQVLIADEHALSNRLDPCQVRTRAREVADTLMQIKQALAWPHMRVLRASSFHHTDLYRGILDQVQERAPDIDHPYIAKQVADTEYLRRTLHGVIKVGWTIGAGQRARRRDELVFDEQVRRCFGNRVGYVYCKAGRSFDDQRRKTVPYVVLDPAARICLRPDENVFRKLTRARSSASPDTVNGYRNHLRTLAYSFSKQVQPLAGPLEHRVQTMISRIVSVPRRAPASMPRAHRLAGRATPRSLPRGEAYSEKRPRATGS